MHWLPVRNAKGGWSISLVMACNASGDVEQIRQTVNTGRLHARVEHNPYFGGGARRCFSWQMPLTNNSRVSRYHSIHASRSRPLHLP
jgi:hypothetical protein